MTENQFGMFDEQEHTTEPQEDTAPEVEQDEDLEDVERVDNVDQAREDAVESAVESARNALLSSASTKDVRKVVAFQPKTRRKLRRRHVDTDVSVSDLTFDAVLAMLGEQAEVDVASPQQAKGRTDRVTLTVPEWWWRLVQFTATAHGGSPADVVATAVKKHLP